MIKVKKYQIMNNKDNFPDEFKIIEEKTYGISRIIFGIFN